MKKILIIINVLLLIGITNISFAQQKRWAVELSSGIKSEIFESTNHEFGYPMTFRPSFSHFEASFRYGIKDYFFLESGLSYVEYNTNWQCGYKTDYPRWKKAFIPKHKLYSALQIPLRVRFSVPICKSNFHFFSTAGIVLQFPLQPKIPDLWFPVSENNPFKEFSGDIISSWEKTKYRVLALSPIHGINILLNPKIGFMYQFNFGLGISVFGEYYFGLLNMGHIIAQYGDLPIWESESWSTYRFKGDYWSAGVGISYTLKKTGVRKKNKL